MPPVGFEPTISAGEQPQTYASDRAATGTGWIWFLVNRKLFRILEKESNLTACLLLTHSIVHKANAMKYLSFSVWPRVPTHCRCRELLWQRITLSDTHTHTHTLGRATLEEGSDRRRDLYLRAQNTDKRQTFMHTVGFESCSPYKSKTAGEAPDIGTLPCHEVIRKYFQDEWRQTFFPLKIEFARSSSFED